MIKAVPALKDLADDQLAALVTLSQNDENAVIAAKVKEIHDQYDLDIKLITGKEKPGGMKTYDHMKTVLADLKKAAEKNGGALQEQIDTLTRERDDLKAKIKEGATDGALKDELEKLKGQIADKEGMIKTLQGSLKNTAEEWQKKLDEAQGQVVALQLDYEFERGLSGVKFKDEALIPKEVRDTFIQHAKEKIRSKYKPDFMEKEGTKVMVLRDATGMIVTNPANLQNPFSPGEMLLTEIATIVDAGKKQQGAGTVPGNGKTGASTFTGTFRNKVEATEALREHLFERGLRAGSEEFQEAFNKEWTERKLSDLPTK